jgi:hypothetical protein
MDVHAHFVVHFHSFDPVARYSNAARQQWMTLKLATFHPMATIGST